MLEDVLAAIWDDGGQLLSDVFFGPSHERWSLRHALSEGVKHRGRLIAFALALAFRCGDIVRFLDRMKTEMAARFPDIEICDFGHVGDGGVHFNLVVAKDDPRLADNGFEAKLREWVFSVCVEDFHGSFSTEHAIGRKDQIFYDLYTPTGIRNLAAAFIRGLIADPRYGAVLRRDAASAI